MNHNHSKDRKGSFYSHQKPSRNNFKKFHTSDTPQAQDRLLFKKTMEAIQSQQDITRMKQEIKQQEIRQQEIKLKQQVDY